MKDVTTAMNLYRECARNLWNLHFLRLMPTQHDWDMKDEFDEICTLLFSSLILNPINRPADKKSHSYEQFPQPIQCLRVVPSVESGVPIYINREVKSTGYWDYPLNIIKPIEADLRLIDYFDFNLLGYRDFQYCRVRIVMSDSYPEITGRDALIGSNTVNIALIED